MVRQHHVTAAVAITLALTASLAPSASADPAPLAGAEAAIAATQYRASSTVRPNPDEQTVTSQAVAALTSSPAPCGDVCSGDGYGLVSTPVHVASSKPVSHANQASSPASCGDVCSGHGYGFVSLQPTSVRVTSGGGLTGATLESEPAHVSCCSASDSPAPAP
jgi:hypothetical protein